MSALDERIRLVGGIVVFLVTLLLLIIVEGVEGQEVPGGRSESMTLTLAEARDLARLNNPAFRIQENDQSEAEWAVREAYFGLLPTASANASAQWVDAGTQSFGIFTGADIGLGSTDYYFSDYSFNLSYRLAGSTFSGIARSRADRTATQARITAAEFILGSEVTRQYLAALRGRDAVRLATRQLERAQENLELVSARVRAGAVVATDGKQAEVEAGRAEVDLLRARNLRRAETHRLMEQIGIVLDAEVELVSEFEVFQPEWNREELLQRALEAHPSLRAFAAAEDASSAGVWDARSSYFPSLSVNASWSGFTRRAGDEEFLLKQAHSSVDNSRDNCLLMNQISAGLSQPLTGYPKDCGRYVLTPEDEQLILNANDAFPFDYTRSPLNIRMQLSIPVFQGFTRQRQVETAQALARDAQENLRAEELRLRTAVNTAYDDLLTAHGVVAIESRNLDVAEDQLTLARERYRLGAAPFLEFLEAQSSLAQAERDYLVAVYDFHLSLSALEAAVGSRLLEDRGAS